MTHNPKSQQERDEFGEDGARASSLIPVHKQSVLDPLYDLQLLRDVKIINERTQRELGPLPAGGLPTTPKRKPTSLPRHDAPHVSTKEESAEDEAMTLNHLARVAALSVATTGTLMANGTSGEVNSTKAIAPTHDTHIAQAREPHWPDNGIAERELGDGENTYPENMFVEYANGQWHAWVIMTNLQGPTKALDFFSGEVLENVTVKNPGDYNDSFVDAHGVTHKTVIHPAFDYKDPRPGGGLGGIAFDGETLKLEGKFRCGALYLDVSQRIAGDSDKVLWSKVPLYRNAAPSADCPAGMWDSLVNTALDLRDGTMLITGDKYIFRVRLSDMTPVGAAPHYRVVEATDVQRVIEQAKGKDIKDASAYLIKQLHLD
jgi:hypothetical protein